MVDKVHPDAAEDEQDDVETSLPADRRRSHFAESHAESALKLTETKSFRLRPSAKRIEREVSGVAALPEGRAYTIFGEDRRQSGDVLEMRRRGSVFTLNNEVIMPRFSLKRLIADADGRYKRFLATEPDDEDSWAWRRWHAAQILDSATANAVIMVVVAVDSVVCARSLTQADTDLTIALTVICAVFYLCEIVAKITSYGLRLYFGSPNELFEFIIVALGLSGVIINDFLGYRSGAILELVPILRLSRVMRTFPTLVKLFPELRSIVFAFIGAMRSISWICLLIFVLTYIYAIMAVYLYGGGLMDDGLENHFESMNGQPLDLYFGDVVAAAGTMLQIITFDAWLTVVRPIADRYYSAWPFFISYAFFGAIGLLSLVVSVLNVEFAEQADTTLSYKRAIAETVQVRHMPSSPPPAPRDTVCSRVCCPLCSRALSVPRASCST